MDPAAIVPVAGMLTALFTMGLFGWSIVQLARSPIGQAIGRRLQGRHGPVDPDLVAEVSALRDQMELLQQQLGETQERLDFTERLLAGRQAGELSRG
jgi:hypothetical protein